MSAVVLFYSLRLWDQEETKTAQNVKDVNI